MFMKSTAILATVAALSIGASAQASTLANTYSSLVVLGDSLSDTGNLFAATAGAPGGPIPGAPYVNGRFSNGPVWADIVGTEFTDVGKASINVAFGGAKATTDLDASPDLAAQQFILGTQLAALPAGTLGGRPLGVVFFGGNDMFAAANSNDPDAIAKQAAADVRSSLTTLVGFGIRDIVVVNSVDVSRTPNITVEGNGDAAKGRQAVLTFNKELSRPISNLQKLGVNEVSLFDLFTFSEGVTADPAAAGYTNASTACLRSFAECILPGAEDSFLFWDDVHPTAEGHRQIASAFSQSVGKTSLLAPVPLPAGIWLLALGMGTLVVARRRTA